MTHAPAQRCSWALEFAAREHCACGRNFFATGPTREVARKTAANLLADHIVMCELNERAKELT